jgi:hypothetical protein
MAFADTRSAIKGRVRATVRVPRSLYNEVRGYVHSGQIGAENFNDFVVAAISAYVRLLRRKQIDAAFAGMAKDTDFQKKAQLVAEEFSPSDWEAFEVGERDPVEA